MPDWKSKVSLSDGEQLRHTGSKATGFMGETDADSYDIIDSSGETVGSVSVEDHVAVRGFKRTITVKQRDAKGSVVKSESWSE